MLIAITSSSGTDSSISINPGPNVKIEANTQGFFLAESADDVKRFANINLKLGTVSRLMAMYCGEWVY